MPRLNFSLRALLFIPAVFTACIALNLRPTYPNAPTEPTPISGPAIYVVQMREYGWPWGCVQADLKPEFDPDWVFAPAYHAGDIFWLPLCANVAVPTVVCVVLLSAMNWWSGRSHNMGFTQGPLSVGDSSGQERGPLR